MLKQRYSTLFHLEVTVNLGERGLNNEPPLWAAYYQIPGENAYLGVGQGSSIAKAMESAAHKACCALAWRGYKI